LAEAADRLNRPITTGKLKEKYVAICTDLLTRLTPLEPYWAYPGSPQFARVQRLFVTGSYDKFGHAVSRINRALTAESYRTGDVDHAGLDDHEMFPADPRQLEQQPAGRKEQLYFEVLVVESMTEALERALRKEVRSWRRPDDEFVYELVVVASGDEALIAARLNVNRQVVVIRRRFSHQSTRDLSTRDLSTLAEFVDSDVSNELADHQSPDERAQILAASLTDLRPELDLYLMTEIEVENIAGPLGQHFRRALPHTVLQRSQGVQPPNRRVSSTPWLEHSPQRRNHYRHQPAQFPSAGRRRRSSHATE
jgi:arginine decarboxylase